MNDLVLILCPVFALRSVVTGSTLLCLENLGPNQVQELENQALLTQPATEVHDCAGQPPLAVAARPWERQEGHLPGGHPPAPDPIWAGDLSRLGLREESDQETSTC